MPLSRKILPHGKAKVQAGIATGSSVSSLNLVGTTLQLNQTNSQPQRTVNLNSLSGTPGGADTQVQFNNSSAFGGGTNKDAFLVKNVPIPEGSTIELLSGNKIFLEDTDIIKIQSDTAASFNCVLSFVEQS